MNFIRDTRTSFLYLPNGKRLPSPVDGRNTRHSGRSSATLVKNVTLLDNSVTWMWSFFKVVVPTSLIGMLQILSHILHAEPCVLAQRYNKTYRIQTKY